MVLYEKPVSYMANWLFTITEENFEVVKSSGLFGVPESSKAPRLVKPGDKLIFYVMKTGAKSLGGMIVGVFRATSSWRRENKRLWPDEIREKKVKYPFRINVEPIKLGAAPFKELVPKLSFVVNKKRPQVHLIGTPANAGRPISDKDLDVILSELK